MSTSELFFIIASVGFITLIVGWAVLIYFIIRVVREVSVIVEEAKNTFLAMRDHLKEEPFVGRFLQEKPAPKKPRARKKKESS